jgi:hypothetical protein
MKCVPPTVALGNAAFYHRIFICMYDKMNTDYFPNHFNDLVFTQIMDCVLCEERNSNCVRIYMGE